MHYAAIPVISNGPGHFYVLLMLLRVDRERSRFRFSAVHPLVVINIWSSSLNIL